MELVSVAAVAENGIIGDDGKLPWPTIPADKEQYRSRVAGHPVVLGRETFDSMREDLPGSTQLVLSRTEREYEVETAVHVGGVEETVERLQTLGTDTAYVLGGGAIYRLFQPHLDRMVLSRVHGEYDGDSYYPEWDESEWELAEKAKFERFTLREWVHSTADG